MNYLLLTNNNFLNVLILLFLTTFTLVEKSIAQINQSHQEKQAIAFDKKWTNELNDFLINHDDMNIRMIGLRESISTLNYSKKDLESIDMNAIAETINDMVANEKLNTQSLMIATEICNYQKFEKLCDNALINKNLILSDPDNLVVYINSLTQAFIDEDRDEINKLVNRMRGTFYANAHNVTSEKFDFIIKQYVIDNPFYKEKIDFEIEFLNNTKIFSQEKTEKLRQDPTEYLLISRLISYQLTLPITHFKTIFDTCKNSDEFTQTCIDIAKILIKHDHAYMPKMVGLQMLITIYTKLKQIILVERFTLEKENNKRQQECFRKIMNISEHSADRVYEMAHYDLYHQTLRELGEFEGYKKLAELNYQKQAALGYEGNMDLDSCYERPLINGS